MIIIFFQVPPYVDVKSVRQPSAKFVNKYTEHNFHQLHVHYNSFLILKEIDNYNIPQTYPAPRM